MEDENWGGNKEAVATDAKVKKTPEAVRPLNATPSTPPFLSPLAELKNKAGKGGWRAIARGNNLENRDCGPL